VTGRKVVFHGAGGASLAATEWHPATAPPEGRPPVLLLHGGGQTRHAFAGTARALAAAGFVAVALDQRGHGDSAWVTDGAYAFSDFADDAATVSAALMAERGQRPVAVGASLGGIAALLALGHDPQVFSGLVLVDVTPRMDPAGVDHVQGFMRSRAREGFASIEEAADAIAAYLPHRPRPTSLAGLRKNLRHDPDGRWRWHWDPRFLDGPRPVALGGSVAIEQALVAAARRLAVPTLLVRGRSSELVSEAHAAEFRALAPAADHVDIAEARHMVAGDRNDAFTQAILEFLQRRFGRGTSRES
jgi:pimeloyl-ACP methyl ester carboxylesterase